MENIIKNLYHLQGLMKSFSNFQNYELKKKKVDVKFGLSTT
jgi:hypothetical protein